MHTCLALLTATARRLIELSPLLLMLPFVVYSVSNENERHSMDDLLLQTPARGLLTSGYGYYPAYLDGDEISIRRNIYIDDKGNERIGTIIEIKRDVVLATPEGTGSMQPLFGEGNTLVQERVDSSTKLNIGDIVVYENEDQLIIHQIIGQGDGCYYAKGINNALPDPDCVAKDRIRYRLLFAIPTK